MASGILEVSLVDAEELKKRSLCSCLNCSHPCFHRGKLYVLIQYGSQKHVSCVAKEEGQKHVWDEKFRFNVGYEGEQDHTNDRLIFRIMDKHGFSSVKSVGQTKIYIKDVLLLGMEEGKLDFGPQKYRVVRSDNRYSGEISVALTFTKVDSRLAKSIRANETRFKVIDEGLRAQEARLHEMNEALEKGNEATNKKFVEMNRRVMELEQIMATAFDEIKMMIAGLHQNVHAQPISSSAEAQRGNLEKEMSMKMTLKANDENEGDFRGQKLNDTICES